MMFAGFFDLPWWGYVISALALTHVTIAAVTIFLHRHQAHHALDLHPVVAHFFRLWLWLTTGMVTREWVAVHRKHHAKVETPEDPHSPQVYGIGRLLSRGVLLYVAEANRAETLEKYGHGTPDDWIETHLYARWSFVGPLVMALVDVLAFGLVAGGLIFLVQMIWIPFWAAGVINGAGHYWGYRNFPVEDASTNLVPWGILIGGEELHNNHHAHPSSAKLSSAWYEVDIGWVYIRLLETLRLARVKKTAPRPRFEPAKVECDAETVQAIIAHRHYVLAQYTRSVREACRQEILKLRATATACGERFDARSARNLMRWLRLHTWDAKARRPIALEQVANQARLVHTVYCMRQELSALWTRSGASTEQLVKQLREWRQRAEASGIVALREFSRRLPHLVRS